MVDHLIRGFVFENCCDFEIIGGVEFLAPYITDVELSGGVLSFGDANGWRDVYDQQDQQENQGAK